jgi:hydroxypyruvate isomerase
MDRRRSIKYSILGLFGSPAWLKISTSPVLGLSGINHSVCRWCYQNIPLPEFADQVKALGIQSIELLSPSEWDTVLDRGLTCAISNGSPLGITKGFNDPDNHHQLLADYARIIPLAAERGIQQIISFSGNRNGLTDEEGWENCARGLEPVLKLAKQYDVKIVMELLNSKIDHPDYQCDRTNWGVTLVEKLGSSHFSLLYDIYHMQIMEGDIIRTIRENIKYISHFHTGGVPGRHELDMSQELNYKAIMEAIRDLDFTGYVAQEFIPQRADAIKSLKKAIEICNV